MRIALQIHDYIAAQEDVEKARAVQIGETTARAPAVGCDTGFPRDFTKVAAAFAIRLIMKEMAVAVAGNKQVGKTGLGEIAEAHARLVGKVLLILRRIVKCHADFRTPPGRGTAAANISAGSAQAKRKAGSHDREDGLTPLRF